jgi:hypothetical protein
MFTNLTTHQAADILTNDTHAGFSYQGAIALVEYLEDLEEDTGEPMCFDPVAIRCDFTEYETYTEWAKDNLTDWNPEEWDDEAIRKYIQYNTHLIEFDGGIIVASF